MTDYDDKLRTTVNELQDELQQLESLEPETRQLLEGALSEIDSALHRNDSASLEHHSLAQRLRETTLEFEESHPTLSRVVGNLIDALGQMGI